MNLLKNIKITKVMPSYTAGTTTRNSSIIDMQGYEGVLFVAAFGTMVTLSVITLIAQQDDVNAAGGMAALAGTATYTEPATAISEISLALDVYKPLKRYMRAQITISAANAEIDAVYAIQYKGKKSPVAIGTVTTEVLGWNTVASPDES